MAGVNPFTFRSGESWLHGLDIRCKTVILCLLSLALVRTGLLGCIFCLAVLLLCLHTIRIPLFRILAQLKWFILFLGLIFLVRSLGTPGVPVVSVSGITLTGQGMADGGMVVFRFFLVMILGLVFSATTRPSGLKSAVQWFLAPIPLVPEKRVGIMVGLSLRFLPLIFKQAGESRDAFHARCGNLRKHPVQRITFLGLPLLKKTFAAADNLTLAMDARCYSEDRTDPEFSITSRDLLLLAVGGVFCLGLLVI